MRLKYWTLCIMIVGLTLSCNKDGGSLEDELQKLPAETQEGKRTAGCLVNGKALLPKGSGLTPFYKCYYQELGSAGNYFSLSFSDKSNLNPIPGIAINTDSLSVQEGMILKLGTQGKGKASGEYFIISNNASPIFYKTYGIVSGELHLKKMDPATFIAAGTFWFNAVNAQGDTIKVTDGRFDMIY